MRVSDYIKSLNLPPLDTTYGPNWYSAGTARIYVLPDATIGLYTPVGNASMYDATADDFVGLCKLYRVELPQAPDEIYTEHSPAIEADIDYQMREVAHQEARFEQR